MKAPSDLALEAVARCWCGPETLTIEFARLLDEVWDQPWLGNATTAELIDELRARCEVNGTLNYRTVDEG